MRSLICFLCKSLKVVEVFSSELSIPLIVWNNNLPSHVINICYNNCLNIRIVIHSTYFPLKAQFFVQFM
jgi:hypothetical protein